MDTSLLAVAADVLAFATFGWLAFRCLKNRAESIHAGWSDQTIINLKICGYTGTALLGIVTFGAALTMREWLLPVTQYFS